MLACQLNDEKQKTYYDLDTSGQDWAEITVQQCVALLDELNFSCSYFLEVRAENNQQVMPFFIFFISFLKFLSSFKVFETFTSH